MGYADTLLANGETVVLRTRQHPLAFIKDGFKGILLWILAALLLIAIPFFDVRDQNLRNLITLFAVAVFVIGLVILIWQYLLWWTEEYIVTNRRLLKVNGVINKRSADSSLEKINDAILSVSLWGRIFNYGDLDIMTAAETVADSYHMLNGAKKFKITMLNEKHALEMEYSIGRMPSAPMRAPVERDEPLRPVEPLHPVEPMGAADPTPADRALEAPPPPPPSGPPPPPPADPALEITQTLARLADLRDKGAITAEEYEAKKAELLGRL